MAKTRSMYQHAGNGQIVTEKFAKAHPEITIKHTIKPPCKPKGK